LHIVDLESVEYSGPDRGLRSTKREAKGLQLIAYCLSLTVKNKLDNKTLKYYISFRLKFVKHRAGQMRIRDMAS